MSKQRKNGGRALRVAAASGIVLGTLVPAAAAFGAPYPDGGNTQVDPNTQVQGAQATKSSSLPFTGGDVTGLALIGVGAVGVGAVFVRQSRRKALA